MLQRIDRTNAAQAQGVVIVIDVIRAFTVAGYAFDRGAKELWLVRTVEDAEALHRRQPDALLIGEVGGRLIPGFHLNNSPAQMAAADVNGRLLIQRTGAGTQGAVSATNATTILLCALTNASATAHYAQKLAASTGETITLLPTATSPDDPAKNEDDICADYVEALLENSHAATAILEKGIDYLHNSGRLAQSKAGDPDFPIEDVPAVLSTNRFNFAMVGQQHAWQGIGYVKIKRVPIES
jgi:2-phosphosulfolactate phosphatase